MYPVFCIRMDEPVNEYKQCIESYHIKSFQIIPYNIGINHEYGFSLSNSNSNGVIVVLLQMHYNNCKL